MGIDLHKDNENGPILYSLKSGDIFTLHLKVLTNKLNLDVLNSGKFKILEIKKIRPRWYIYKFHHRFSIPKPYKIWIVKLMVI